MYAVKIFRIILNKSVFIKKVSSKDGLNPLRRRIRLVTRQLCLRLEFLALSLNRDQMGIREPKFGESYIVGGHAGPC